MTHVIILAGGKGTRIGARLDAPKALFEVDGVSLLSRVLSAVRPICATPTIVIGFGGDSVIAATGNREQYVWQREQLGTGHAVLSAREALEGRHDIDTIIVLYGDHPFVSTATLRRLASFRKEHDAVIALATVVVPDFTGDDEVFARFGRVVRDGAGGMRIVEFKDADSVTRSIREVNPGYYCFEPRWLWGHIAALSPENAAGEYYLTDLIHIAAAEHSRIDSFIIEDSREGMGVNTLEEYVVAERLARRHSSTS